MVDTFTISPIPTHTTRVSSTTLLNDGMGPPRRAFSPSSRILTNTLWNAQSTSLFYPPAFIELLVGMYTRTYHVPRRGFYHLPVYFCDYIGDALLSFIEGFYSRLFLLFRSSALLCVDFLYAAIWESVRDMCAICMLAVSSRPMANMSSPESWWKRDASLVCGGHENETISWLIKQYMVDKGVERVPYVNISLDEDNFKLF